MNNDQEHKFRTVPYNFWNSDKQILINCFRKDGKMRAPTKSKLWNLICGEKKELTYSEIRYILKYVDEQYRLDLEYRFKNGCWWDESKEKLIQRLGISDVDETVRITPNMFLECVNKIKEKRNPSFEKTHQLLESIIMMNHEANILPPPPPPNDNKEIEEIQVKLENDNDNVNLTDYDLSPISPRSIKDEYINNNQCLVS